MKINISGSTENFADFVGNCPEIITLNSEILFKKIWFIKVAQISIRYASLDSELNSDPKFTLFLSQIKSRVPHISDITYHNLLMAALSLLLWYFWQILAEILVYQRKQIYL